MPLYTRTTPYFHYESCQATLSRTGHSEMKQQMQTTIMNFPKTYKASHIDNAKVGTFWIPFPFLISEKTEVQKLKFPNLEAHANSHNFFSSWIPQSGISSHRGFTQSLDKEISFRSSKSGCSVFGVFEAEVLAGSTFRLQVSTRWVKWPCSTAPNHSHP